MASKQKSAVFEHFTLTSDFKHYVCQCTTGRDGEETTCGVKISASGGGTSKGHAPTRASNLKRHLERCHNDIFKLVQEKDKGSSETPTASKLSTEKKPATASLTSFFVSDKVTISMTPDAFKRNIVKITVLNGISLRFFSRPEVLALIGELARKLGVALNRDNIRKLVIDEYESQKEQLKKKLSNKFVYLKMDACTRHRVNYFAVNVRYVDEGKNMTKTLAIKDTEAQHSSNFLKQLVKEVLQEFGIQKDHVLCIVTDNASNMLSMVKRLNEREDSGITESEECAEEIQEEQPGPSHSRQPIDLDDLTKQQEDLNFFEGFEEVPSYIEEFADVAVRISEIEHQRCCVHTHQLAVNDALKEHYSSNLIAKVRKVATAARTPKLDAILKRRAGKGAIIDQVTRWGSTYNMVKRLVELKPVLIDMANPDVSLSEVQWMQLEELEDLLKLPFQVTKKLQEEDLTPGMFLKEWKMLEHSLSRRGGLFAETMRESMRQREVQLLNNKILLAGVYVDPMNRVLLSETQKDEAKLALCDLAVRILGLNAKAPAEDPDTLSSSTDSEGTCTEEDFDKLLDQQDHKARSKRRKLEEPAKTPSVNKGLASFKLDFHAALQQVEQIDRKSKLNVHDAIKQYPEIVKESALLAAALPPTQVSVERLFSALRLIRTDQRASMKEKLTEAILFLRANY